MKHLHRRYEAGIETPKRDKVDQLAYKTIIADQLLTHEYVDNGAVEVEDGIEELPLPEAGVAKKRKKPTPLPSDATRTTGVKHMPQLVETSTVRHRCRFPGCKSNNARFFCNM